MEEYNYLEAVKISIHSLVKRETAFMANELISMIEFQSTPS